MSEQVMIISHAVDMDGWFSAAVLMLKYGKENCIYVPADYAYEASVFTALLTSIIDGTCPKTVFITDFSFNPNNFRAIAAAAQHHDVKVWWFDHHESAIERTKQFPALTELPGVRNIDYSAAKLVADWAGAEDKQKQIIQVVSDYDTWNFDEKKYWGQMGPVFNAWFNFQSLPPEKMVDRAITVLTGNVWEGAMELGSKLILDKKAQFESIAKQAMFVQYDNLTAAVFNCSEKGAGYVAINLYDKCDFAVSWRVLGNGKVSVSFCSDESGPDVSKIASKFGGGGHEHASGATVSFQTFSEAFLSDI